MSEFSRRRFLKSAAAVVSSAAVPIAVPVISAGPASPLQQFSYGDVHLAGALHEQQLDAHLQVLMSLSEDSLLKPFRQMIGRPAPGTDLGGWYGYDADHYGIDGAYAPSATFGQWISALARMYAIRRSAAIRDKLLRLNQLYASDIEGRYFEVNRFPAYCYDKLLCGLIDAHEFAQDPQALQILERTTDAALPHLPGRAIDNGVHWRQGKDSSYDSDESYTNSENLFLAWQRGAGARYRQLAIDYLDENFYAPLSAGRSNFAGRHAYSYVNSLSSAMQAYLSLGTAQHLRAAHYGFSLLSQQSFATGGWGPDETLRAPGGSDLYASLSDSHRSFEAPCGAYAHFKLARYLLRVTGDSSYGDSMERVMYNTVLGAKPLLADGRCFYYADYHQHGRKVYSDRRWACCSGTLPLVAADYRLNVYFRAPRNLFVNLYIPSTLQWTEGGARAALTQTGNYPFDSHIEFELQLSAPREFALRLRIPAWAHTAALAVNGRRAAVAVNPGRFATLWRLWKSGDRVQLELPLTTRLAAIDAAHTDTVALLVGPLVLFALTDDQPRLSAGQLLAARRSGAQGWEVATDDGLVPFLPFTAIGEQQYTTYLKLS
jgi:uncharacterized protein